MLTACISFQSEDQQQLRILLHPFQQFSRPLSLKTKSNNLTQYRFLAKTVGQVFTNRWCYLLLLTNVLFRGYRTKQAPNNNYNDDSVFVT